MEVELLANEGHGCVLAAWQQEANHPFASSKILHPSKGCWKIRCSKRFGAPKLETSFRNAIRFMGATQKGPDPIFHNSIHLDWDVWTSVHTAEVCRSDLHRLTRDDVSLKNHKKT